MTAQNSATKSGFLRYFLYKLGTLKQHIILNFIMALFSYPAIAVVGLITNNKWNEYYKILGQDNNLEMLKQCQMWNNILIMFVYIAVFALIGVFFTGLAIQHKNFRYLYDKKYVDMDISLPVSDNGRFFGDFLSGILAYIVPHAMAIGIGLLIFINTPPVATQVMDNGIITEYTKVTEMEMFGVSAMDILWQCAVIGLLSCLLFYCLNLFILSLCGRAAETRLTTVIINIALPLLTFTLVVLSQLYYYGKAEMTELIPFFYNSAVANLSPMGMLAATLVSLIEVGSYHNNIYTFIPLRNGGAIISIIACALFTAAAYILIRKRRNERTGSPYVFKSMRHIVSALIALSVFSVSVICEFFGKDYGWSYAYVEEAPEINFVNLIPAFVITFIIFIIMELISGNGFKKFHFTLLRYAAAAGGSLLVCLLLLNSKGFGAEGFVPAPDNVVYASVSFSQEANAFGTMKLYNTEDIIKFHKDYIDDRTLYRAEKPYANNNYFSVRYLLKNGDIVRRTYSDIDGAYIDDIVRLCLASGGFRNQYEPMGEVSDVASITYDYPDNETDMSASERQADIPPEKLFEALAADAENVTFEQLFVYPHQINASTRRYINVEWKNPVYNNDTLEEYGTGGQYNKYYEIYPFFENTINLFSDYGIELFYKQNVNCERAVIIKAESDYFNSCWYTYMDSYEDDNGKLCTGNIHIADINSQEFKELVTKSNDTIYYGEVGEDIYCVAELYYSEADKSWYSWNAGMVAPEYLEKAKQYYNSTPTADLEFVKESFGIKNVDENGYIVYE